MDLANQIIKEVGLKPEETELENDFLKFLDDYLYTEEKVLKFEMEQRKAERNRENFFLNDPIETAKRYQKLCKLSDSLKNIMAQKLKEKNSQSSIKIEQSCKQDFLEY